MSLYLTFLNLIHLGLIQTQGFGSSVPCNICSLGQSFSLGVTLRCHVCLEDPEKIIVRENWYYVGAKRSKYALSWIQFSFGFSFQSSECLAAI